MQKIAAAVPIMHTSMQQTTNTLSTLESIDQVPKMLLIGNWLSQAAQSFQMTPTQQAQCDLLISLFRTSTLHCRQGPSADYHPPGTLPPRLYQVLETASKDIIMPFKNTDLLPTANRVASCHPMYPDRPDLHLMRFRPSSTPVSSRSVFPTSPARLTDSSSIRVSPPTLQTRDPQSHR